ncbi:MAG: hypothetical protein KDA58_11460 [Planctomycetaceae bacterium]|nr:hypothetical protein [Planctomycetaceae bacterium]
MQPILSSADSSQEGNRLARWIIAVCGAVTAGWVALLFVLGITQADSVDVIGVSLFRGFDGYSERGERNALHAFLAVICLVSPVIHLWARRLPERVQQPLAWGLLWLCLILAGGRIPLLYTLSIAAAFWCAFRLGRWFGTLKVSVSTALPVLGLSLCVWGAATELASRSLGNPPTSFVFISLAVLLPLLVMRSIAVERFWSMIPTIYTLAGGLLLAWGIMLHSRGGALLILLLVVAIALEDALRPIIRSMLGSGWTIWICGLCLMMFVQQFSPINQVLDAAYLFLASAATALLIRLGLPLRSLCPGGLDVVWQFSLARNWRRYLPWGLPAAILLCQPGLNWCCACLCIAALAATLSEVRSLRGSFVKWLATLLLVIAFWPDSPFFPGRHRNEMDAFHEGQILSAVWEFEHGRRLVTEVFPLRSTEFFLSLFSRACFGHTVAATDLTFKLEPVGIVLGACMIASAWMRSCMWTLVTGIWAASCCLLLSHSVTDDAVLVGGIRGALILCGVGLAMHSLGRFRSRAWIPLGLIGALLMICGVDIGVPFLAAAVLAIIFSQRRPTCLAGYIPIAGQLAGLLLMAGGCVSALIYWLSGPAAIREYWLIIGDYMRNYSSFYGLPMGDAWYQHRPFRNALVGLGLFAAGAAAAIESLSPLKRAYSVLLLTTCALFLHRGIGRSDQLHLNAAVLPALILWPLLLFSLVRLATFRLRFRRRGMEYSVVAYLLYFSLSTLPTEHFSLPRFLSMLREMPQDEQLLLGPNSQIASVLNDGDFLWAVDYGLANIEQQRHNPTRHALAYCIGSPAEQARAIGDLRRNRTPLIIWGWSPCDEIAGLLRHWMLATAVLREYRPADVSLGLSPYPTQLTEDVPQRFPFARLAEHGWSGLTELPAGFAPSEMHFGRIPLVWGTVRLADLEAYVRGRQMLSWSESLDHPGNVHAYQLDANFTPREWNFLKVTLSVDAFVARSGRIGGGASSAACVIELYDESLSSTTTRLQFDVAADGLPHTYLIPVGCHPGWTWIMRFGRVELSCGAEGQMHIEAAELLEIDEVGRFR